MDQVSATCMLQLELVTCVALARQTLRVRYMGLLPCNKNFEGVQQILIPMTAFYNITLPRSVTMTRGAFVA